jgi:hypothetical protein
MQGHFRYLGQHRGWVYCVRPVVIFLQNQGYLAWLWAWFDLEPPSFEKSDGVFE